MDISFFLLFCLVPILILNFLSINPQKKFTKRYNEKFDSNDFIGPGEYIKKYRQKPIDQMKDSPSMMRSRVEMILGKDYKDKELNQLAFQIRLFYIGQIIFLFIFSIFIASKI